MIRSVLRKLRFILPITSLLFSSVLQAQTPDTVRMNLQEQLPVNDTWWQTFGDATLDSLIRKAVANNYNLLNAINHIEIAKTKLRIQQSGYYPVFTLSAAYTPEKNSLGIEHINERNNIGEAAVNMSWEIDVFGSIRKSAKSQKQFYYASQENYRAVMVSLAAELSSAYVNLRAYQQQSDIARRNLASQQEILSLTETKFAAGLASKLDVAQAKSLYLQTKAIIPGTEAAIASQINMLSVLTGEYSAPLQQELAHPKALPTTSNTPMSGIPAELIRRRPDIRAAEQTLDALASATGATRADWWPKFYVNGSFGYGADKFKQFTKNENMEWQISPSIKWTIFSGRRMIETTKNAMLQLDEGINNYNNTLLTALQEVDDAMNLYNKSLLQLNAGREALEQVKITFGLAVDLYEKGLTNYQSVLDSQRNMLRFENTLITAESNTLLYLIQLYKALGGGVTTASPE